MAPRLKTLAVIVTMLTCMVSGSMASEIGQWHLLIPKQAYTVRTNPLNPNRIYVGNWANQLLMSEDKGASWHVSELGSLGATNFLTSVHVCHTDTNIVLVGGYVFTGIKRSTDGCRTWNQVLQDLSGRQMWFISEAITESIDGNLYAARGRSISNIYRSTNKGETWDSISNVPFSLTSKLCTITAHPTDANLLFLGAKEGKIFRSTDAGMSWTQSPVDGKDSIRDDSEIPKIVFSPNNPDRGYAVVAIALEAGLGGNGGILKTTDRGVTWNRIGFVDTSFWAIDVLKTESGVDDILIGGFRIAEIDTIVKGDSLVYRSKDGGITWQQYQGIDWQKNEIGQTVKSVWSFYRAPNTTTEYMATQVGLYVLDESSSVEEDNRQQAARLYASFNGSGVTVTDLAPRTTDARWELYDMASNLVGSGQIISPQMELATSHLSSGSYLLVWGNETDFRTVGVQVVR